MAKIASLVFDNRSRGRNGALRATVLLKLQRLVEPYRSVELTPELTDDQGA